MVTWTDAHMDDAPYARDFEVTTVGFVTERGSDHVSVAAEALPDGEWRCVTHIPREVVRKVVTLRADGP